ncbi:MAG: DUF5367 family protein [Terricaulis sp.]
MIARWVIAGFILWVLVMVAFNFVLGSPAAGIPGLFLILPIVMFALTFILFKLFKVDESDRAEAASIFTLPGMLIGGYLAHNPTQIFANLTTQQVGADLTSLMIASYAAVIISGLVFSRLQKVSDKD